MASNRQPAASSAQTDPIRYIWNRIRALGRKVEEEVYDFTEEDAESEREARGRNTLIALDGNTEIRTPHDDCLLVMPSLRPSRGHTAVRLARFDPL